MKLSRLYTNQPKHFEPIQFTNGLNVVLGEIKDPANKNKDTHNLGKSTLGRVLDFCFLSKKDKDFFLFKHEDKFSDFIFYLEIEATPSKFITIARSVKDATKISFKESMSSEADLSDLDESGWTYSGVAFDKAKQLLDTYLDLSEIKPYDFRKSIGYLIREQDDYGDVFQLKKFKGSHADWKPYLAHILGFNSKLLETQYETEEKIANLVKKEQILNAELGGTLQDLSKIEGTLLIKEKELKESQDFIDKFDFSNQDKEKVKTLVERIDLQSGALNERKYILTKNKWKIEKSLSEEVIEFSVNDAESLFKEANVLFEGQIKKEFSQLIAFNKAIAKERKQYLVAELKEIENSLLGMDKESVSLSNERSKLLSFLTDSDSLQKYKFSSIELVGLKSEVEVLKRQRDSINKLRDLRKEIRATNTELGEVQESIENDVESKNSESTSFFSKVRIYFNEIIERVINHKAVLNVFPNKEGHLEFKVEILDENHQPTSADVGHSYKKLLCIAFDMAIARAHSANKFPKFIFHDGIFDSLDDRKKVNLKDVLNEYASYGVQHIITLIDSELPVEYSTKDKFFSKEDIILLLNDSGDLGRLFKFKSW